MIAWREEGEGEGERREGRRGEERGGGKREKRRGEEKG